MALSLPGQLSNDTSEECGGELLIGVHLYIAQEREKKNSMCDNVSISRHHFRTTTHTHTGKRERTTPYINIFLIVALKRTKALV